jgi:hypothetical protein
MLAGVGDVLGELGDEVQWDPETRVLPAEHLRDE